MADKKEKGKAKDKKESKSKASEVSNETTPKVVTPPVAEKPVQKKDTSKQGKSNPPKKTAAEESKSAPKGAKSKPGIERTQDLAARVAEERRLAVEKAAEEAKARKDAWNKYKAELAEKAAERAQKMKEESQARRAERDKARALAAEAAKQKAMEERQKREAQRIERDKARAEARTQAIAKPALPKAEGVKSAATAKPTTPAAKAQAKQEPVAIGLNLGLPKEVLKAFDVALRNASKSTQDQVLGYLKIPADIETRLKSKLELQRKKIAKAIDDAVYHVIGKLVSETPAEKSPSYNLSLQPKTGRAVLHNPELTWSQALLRNLQVAMRDLSAHLQGEEGALNKFPSLAQPVMLQFFADLPTGQQLDGSLIISFNGTEPHLSTMNYNATLGGSGKKSKEPIIALQFEHDIALKTSKGSLSASFVIQIPEETPKSSE